MGKAVFILFFFVCSIYAYPPSVTVVEEENNQPLVTEGNKPNLPSGRIIGNAPRKARDAAKDEKSANAGGFFDSISAGAHFSLTSFRDGDFGSSGKVDERALSLSGYLNESTSISFTYSKIKYRYGKFSPASRITAHGYELAIHHNFHENYGIGAYGFYQDIDIENTGDSYTIGGGVNFTTFHDLGPVNLATVTNLTYVDYDFDDDFLLILLADVSRDITDWMAIGANISWTDSLTDNSPNTDDNYWTLGLDLRFNWNSFDLSVGWEKTYDYSDYKDNTLNVSLSYTF